MSSRISLVGLSPLTALSVELVFEPLDGLFALSLLSCFFDSQDQKLSQRSRILKALLIGQVVNTIAEMCVDRVKRYFFGARVEVFEGFIDLCRGCWAFAVCVDPQFERFFGERTLHFFYDFVDSLLDSTPIIGSCCQSIAMRLNNPSFAIIIINIISIKLSLYVFAFLKFLTRPCCNLSNEELIFMICLHFDHKKLPLYITNRATIKNNHHYIVKYFIHTFVDMNEAISHNVKTQSALNIKNTITFTINTVYVDWCKYTNCIIFSTFFANLCICKRFHFNPLIRCTIFKNILNNRLEVVKVLSFFCICHNSLLFSGMFVGLCLDQDLDITCYGSTCNLDQYLVGWLRGLIQRRRQAAEQAAEDGGEDDDAAA